MKENLNMGGKYSIGDFGKKLIDVDNNFNVTGKVVDSWYSSFRFLGKIMLSN